MKTSTLFAVALTALVQIPAAFAAPEASRLPVDPPTIVARDGPKQAASSPAAYNALRSQGCYSYAGSNYTKLGEKDIETAALSTGECGKVCKDKEYNVMALYGGACFCGDYYPPEGSKVQDSKCNFACPAYPQEACGSLGTPKYYGIFNTGLEINVEPMPKEKKEDDDDKDKDKEDKKTSTTSSSSSAPTSEPTAPAATETNSDGSDGDGDGDDEKKDEKKTNVAGIAAGVVVGVAVIAGAIGGFFFWMRRRRNSELEEDHRRNAAVNAFINGSKPPSSHGSISMTDSRMDPVLANRRLSDGSIADNQDYSRRILRVTNA